MGSVEKVVHPDSTYEIRRYVAGAIITTQYSAGGGQISSTSQYVLKDHLGSVDMIIDQHGNVVGANGANTSQAMSFDPWGWRRNVTATNTVAANNWTGLSVSALNTFSHPITNKGFTGHEMVDEIGIIHMGGRIYDPRIGRFLQADPTIQSPANTQSYNRYSYGWNNPLGGVDPSGYSFWSKLVDPAGLFKDINVQQIWQAAVIVVSAVACGATYGAACAAAAAIATTKMEGGTWSQALRAGAIAGVSTYAMGEWGENDFSSVGAGAETIGVDGTIGGITSVLQGGSFGNGFVSAGIGAAAGGLSANLGAPMPARIAIAAVAGGTISAMTGGKFANGAITAAFAAAMGEAAASNAKGGTSVNANTNGNDPDFSKTPAPTSGDVVGTPDMDRQAIDLAEETRIGRNETAITVTANAEVRFTYGANSNASCFAGGGGLCFHTHPKQDYGGTFGRNASQAHRLVFSPGDANIVQQGLPNYMLNYQRQLQVLEYRSDAGGYVPRVIQNVPYRGDE